MVPDTKDEKIRQDERNSIAPGTPDDRKNDSNAIYNTPYHLPMAGLEKVEVYPY